MRGWIGVDLDGTLAEYHGWKPGGPIGDPVPAMLKRVKRWLSEGKEVHIFTARVASQLERPEEEKKIRRWCRTHLGRELPITNAKDHSMIECWDDRAVEVIKNRGLPVNLQRRKD